MPPTPEDLLPALADLIRNTIGVGIFSVRFLQSDPAKRARKGSCLVVVSVPPAEEAAFGSSIRPFSSSRQVEHAYYSSQMTQCKHCFPNGHPAPQCKVDYPVCPICSLSHCRSAHRYTNPTCPLEGNIKAVPACCPAPPPKCTNCQGEHIATDPTWPSRPRLVPAQENLRLSHPLPADDTMDMMEDTGFRPTTAVGRTPVSDLTTPHAVPRCKAIAAPLPNSKAQLPSWVEGTSSSPSAHD